jgi:hypothetical protein
MNLSFIFENTLFSVNNYYGKLKKAFACSCNLSIYFYDSFCFFITGNSSVYYQTVFYADDF